MGIQWRRFTLLALIYSGAVLAGSACLGLAEQSRPDDPARSFSKANKERIEAYVVLLRLRQDLFLKWKETGKWPEDTDANNALAAHSEYWARQLKEGRALLAGGMKGDYWDNVALIVFEAGSEAQAQQIVKDDPAVKAYVFQAQVRPFDVHFISDKYATDR